MLNTLLLFDIDGTLIKGSRAARIAFARAIQTCLGVDVDLSALQSAGKTDYRIMREIVEEHRLPRERVDWEALRTSFLHHFEDAIRLDPGQICPGVRSLLEVFSRQAGIVLALGTGNLERSARMKLAAHDLDAFFATGGFGDDGIDREAVITAGIARAEAHHRTGFQRVVVVGDTPHDVACARANKVHSVCVATGPFNVETLRLAGAMLVFPDFTWTQAVVLAIDSLPPTGQNS